MGGQTRHCKQQTPVYHHLRILIIIWLKVLVNHPPMKRLKSFPPLTQWWNVSQLIEFFQKMIHLFLECCCSFFISHFRRPSLRYSYINSSDEALIVLSTSSVSLLIGEKHGHEFIQTVYIDYFICGSIITYPDKYSFSKILIFKVPSIADGPCMNSNLKIWNANLIIIFTVVWPPQICQYGPQKE